jgi:hypothetical protein
MRLVTYERRGARRLGAAIAGVVVDLPDAVGHPAFPRTMEELVEHHGGSILAAARLAIDQPEVIAEFGVFHPRLLSPLVPASFLEPGGEGSRGASGSSAGDDAGAVEPAVSRAVLGPGGILPWPRSIPLIGCHVEVGCVVGRRGRRMSARDASRAVFGYTVMVQWSPAGRDRVSAPFATSLGPWIVTADEADLDGAETTASIDGEVVATAVLRPAPVGFADLIAGASRAEDVGPGDVLGSTPFGASFDLTLDRRAVAGSIVEIAVDGIGSLATRVGAARRSRHP